MNQLATLLSAACVASLLNAPADTPKPTPAERPGVQSVLVNTPEPPPDKEPVVVVSAPTAAAPPERTVIVTQDKAPAVRQQSAPTAQTTAVCTDGVCLTPPQPTTAARVTRTRIYQPAEVRYAATQPAVVRGGTTTYTRCRNGQCYTTRKRTYSRRWYYRR